MTVFMMEEIVTILIGFLVMLPSALLGIVSYVLSAAAIYVIARRRGLRKPWLAWIPLVNIWLLGSLSDQYNYVVRRKNTSRRKWLLALKILKPICMIGVLFLGGGILRQAGYGVRQSEVLEMFAGMAGFTLPLIIVSVAAMVLRYIALYDVYKSLEPANAVLFLVLSICFGITEPFFLFFNREKDLGMPPRKVPVYEASKTETWEDA